MLEIKVLIDLLGNFNALSFYAISIDGILDDGQQITFSGVSEVEHKKISL